MVRVVERSLKLLQESDRDCTLSRNNFTSWSTYPYEIFGQLFFFFWKLETYFMFKS